ncbi:MAG: pyridoxal phosphate-dependent aminotransferase [Fimbriiglobus sp.]
MSLPFALKKLLVRTGAARFLPAARRLTDDGVGYLRYYSDRVIAAPVDELLDPATFPESPAPDVMNLNEAAPWFDSPVSAGRVAADRSGKPPARGLPGLREAVADAYRHRDGRAIDPTTDVLVTHGATGAFAAALDAFVNPGDPVVLLDPCSPTFALGAKSRRARVRWVPSATTDGRLTFDPAAMMRALRGAKLLAIADPANPTGGALAADDLERLAWHANRADVLIYLDETFGRFRYDGRPCGLATMPGAERRTLSVGSITGSDGLGSVRVGWLTGPRHLVRACGLTATLSAPFVPTVCQHVALRALQAGDETFGPVLEQFRSRRRYAFDRLKGMGSNPAWPSGGFFFWVPVSSFGLDGRAFADRLLKEQRVLVGPGCAFGPSGTGFVRVSFAAEDGRMREGLARLAAFVAGLRGQPVVHSARVPAAPVPTADTTTVEPEPDRKPTFSRV